MPMPKLIDDSSDFEKLIAAFGGISSISSFEDVLGVFGLAGLPTAQRYGIIFGCLTFFVTISTVLALLVFGGTFARLAEQNQTGKATIPDAIAAREGRPLLLERLIDAQERMMANYPEKYKRNPSSIFTVLTKMLLNVAPEKISKKKIIENYTKNMENDFETYFPEGYQENYVYAYRRCQDKPGGKIISGVPEARFEAYARAYAGCGMNTSAAYKRSYARMYEAVSCVNHTAEKKHSELFATRPQDIYGRTIRLEPLEAKRHAQLFFDITSGDSYEDVNSYNPNKVWGFLDFGPFESKEKLIQSPVFSLKSDEAAFGIIESLTDRIIGVVHLTNDDPKNLNVQLELPIMKPSADGTVEQIEACFLLLDRLFALGYRRIQLAIDSQDVNGKKLPGRLGFTQEGILPKHKIVKEANRDSIIYGMLNSDWSKGARAFLFKKLHGEKAQRVDAANDAKEGELEEQQRVLKERKKKQKEQKVVNP